MKSAVAILVFTLLAAALTSRAEDIPGMADFLKR